MENFCKELLKSYEGALNQSRERNGTELGLEEKDLSAILARDAYSYLADKEELMNHALPWDYELARRHVAAKNPLEKEFESISSSRLGAVVGGVNETLQELSKGRYKIIEIDDSVWMGAKLSGSAYEPMMLVRSNNAIQSCMNPGNKDK